MSKKLSKSTALDPRTVEALAAVFETAYAGRTDLDHEELALAVLTSDWLRAERSSAFWDGVHELGMLTGSIDDYTLACIVDPYSEETIK